MEKKPQKVQPQDPSLQNSPIVGESQAKPASADATADGGCYWDGQYYSEYSTVCKSPDLLRCEGGSWALYGNC